MQFPDIEKRSIMAARYASLWNNTHKKHEIHNNATFYVYMEIIQNIIDHIPCIPPHIIEVYNLVVCFKATPHYMWIQPKKDQTQ